MAVLGAACCVDGSYAVEFEVPVLSCGAFGLQVYLYAGVIAYISVVGVVYSAEIVAPYEEVDVEIFSEWARVKVVRG